jgi:hypothetical protein
MDDSSCRPVAHPPIPFRWWAPRAAWRSAKIGGGLALLCGLPVALVIPAIGEGPVGDWRETLAQLVFVLGSIAVGAIGAGAFTGLLVGALDLGRLLRHWRAGRKQATDLTAKWPRKSIDGPSP